MSEFSGKVFYFLGDFSFFSDEQRDDALKFHGGILADSLGDSVDYIVEGNHDGKALSNKEQEGKTLLSELKFMQSVIFTSYASEGDEDDDGSFDGEEVLSVYMNINGLVKSVQKIKEGVIYSCLFVYPSEDDENPIIRCLFSYLKSGSQVLYACRGLTNDSSDIPLTQFGLLDISGDVMAAAFESFDDLLINDQLYIAKADMVSGDGFYDSSDSEESLEIPEESKLALECLDAFQQECYFIDDSDEGYYRLSDNFYKKHKKILDAEEGWVEKGFSTGVYHAAESVLMTGQGWLL